MGPDFLSVSSAALVVWDYPVSYLELVGAIFGLLSVWFASRVHVLTWPTGLVSVALLGILFYQVRLYADMALQVYFFAVSLFGWRNWRTPSTGSGISKLSWRARGLSTIALALCSTLAGFAVAHAHVFMPSFFQCKAAFPYLDAFILIASVMATWLLAQKRIECWVLWIAADLCGITLFYQKDLVILCFEYVLFLALASYGLYHWYRYLRNDQGVHIR